MSPDDLLYVFVEHTIQKKQKNAEVRKPLRSSVFSISWTSSNLSENSRPLLSQVFSSVPGR